GLQGTPEAARREQRIAKANDINPPPRMPRWPVAAPASEDVVDPDTLAYSSANDNIQAAHATVNSAAKPALAAMVSLAPARLTSVIKKQLAPLRMARAAAADAPPDPAPSMDNPWIRALMLTPDMRNFMTTSIFGAPDMHGLGIMMKKPHAVVAITFTDQRDGALSADRFTGSAFAFQPTIGFQTAQLQ
ncbi:MAG: hypothetical protein HY056_05880, partial [Proteobacteria bacterium]|nr:hypothetical protein [Pseudomonadota bacterium]